MPGSAGEAEEHAGDNDEERDAADQNHRVAHLDIGAY